MKRIFISFLLLSCSSLKEKPKPVFPSQKENFLFRVQVASFTKEEDAFEFAKNFSPPFDKPIFISYEPPLYMVRVGEFKTRREAELYLKLLLREGMGEAFVVLSNPANETPIGNKK